MTTLSFVFTVEGTGGGTSTITYRDIVVSNVKDGLAEKLSIGSGESVSQGATTTYGAMNADGFDLKRLFEFTGIVKPLDAAWVPTISVDRFIETSQRLKSDLERLAQKSKPTES